MGIKEQAHRYIAKNRAAALATVSDKGVPHSAIVYCIVNEDLSLYFSTRVESRKYRNIMSQSQISMAFFNEKELTSIQLTGEAERVNRLDIEQSVLRKLILFRYKEPNWPVPPIKIFERGATNELAIIKVIPNEMVFANFTTTKTGRYKPFFKKVI